MTNTVNIYVSNGTMQNHDLHYRLQGHDRLLNLMLRPGGQGVIRVPSDQVKAIEDQLRRAGAVEAMNKERIVRPFSLMYHAETPIMEAEIKAAMGEDEEARQEVSAQATEESGLAVFAAAKQRAAGDVRTTSLEVVQLGAHEEPLRGAVDAEVTVTPDVEGRRTAQRRRA